MQAIRQARNGFSGYGSAAGQGGLPNPPAVFNVPVPAWVFGGGGGLSQASSQAGFPGILPQYGAPQIAADPGPLAPVVK